MRKYLYILFTFMYLSLDKVTFALDPTSTSDLKDAITPAGSNAVLTSGETGESLLDAVLEFIRDSIFTFMALIAIGMFIYIGARLLMARGNPEELKKAFNSLIYAAIGIFAVAAAWALVRFVAGINIL